MKEFNDIIADKVRIYIRLVNMLIKEEKIEILWKK